MVITQCEQLLSSLQNVDGSRICHHQYIYISGEIVMLSVAGGVLFY